MLFYFIITVSTLTHLFFVCDTFFFRNTRYVMPTISNTSVCKGYKKDVDNVIVLFAFALHMMNMHSTTHC